MAKRKPKPPRVRAAPPDLGTPETRARLVPPPWLDWPRELQEAALEMDTAVRVRIEALRAKAQILGRIGGRDIGDDLPPHERRCYRKYLGWLALMRACGWSGEVQGIIACVVDHAPVGDVWQLRAALTLWATGRLLVLPR